MSERRRKRQFRGKSTAASERYLAYLEHFGPERSLADLARLAGCTRNAVYNWRRDMEGFREREEGIRKKCIAKVLAEADNGTTVGLDLVKGLSKLEAQFLELYSTTKDRVASAKQLGVPWVHFERRIEENPRFREGYEAVLRGLVIANEDTVLRRGATGDVGAAKVTLKAHLPERYGDRVVVDQHASLDVRITGDETVKQLGGWIKRFGRLQPASEFRPERLLSERDEDVIDAETVESAEPTEAEAVAV